MSSLSCFKAYDVRGRVDIDINEDLVRALGFACVHVTGAKHVVIGGDARETSPTYRAVLAEALSQAGAQVTDLGLCGTEEVYFGTAHADADMGIMVTASHNPIDYNGFKMVGPGAAPLADDLFRAIEVATKAGMDDPTATGVGTTAATPGTIAMADFRDAYVAHLLTFIDVSALRPLNLVVNAGNGAAGPTFDAVAAGLAAAGAPLNVTRVHHAADHTFPNGIPNPLLPENQPKTADVVVAQGAAMGVAWDGDFDRCFFFDGDGGFVAGEYVVSLLAQAVLGQVPGAKIVHDPRVQWSTQSVVADLGGEAIASQTGHALIKAKMRAVDAVYGGEMSAHHYFREFMYCDSGMIPWLLVWSLMSTTGHDLKALVANMRTSYPSSGEMNFTVEDPAGLLEVMEAKFGPDALSVDHLDGVSIAYPDWRFNLRKSNTEPLVRLNVETRGDTDLLAQKVTALRAVIEG